MRKLYIFILLVLTVSGCITSKPMVSMTQGVSLTGYKVFEVPNVQNETGNNFEFDVASTLTKSIKSELKDKGYVVLDNTSTTGEILIIKSSLLSYEPGNAVKRWLAPGFGPTQATVKTSLIEKRTGRVLGEFISAETVSSGGLYSAGADRRILDAIAEGIVNELEKKIKGE